MRDPMDVRYPWELSDAEYFARLEDEALEPLSVEDQINDVQAAMLRTDLSAVERCHVRLHAAALTATRAALQRKVS